MSFASRICTTIVAHSEQQTQINNLSEAYNTTVQERDHLRSENAKLNQDVGELDTIANSYSRERDEAIKQVQELQGKLRYQEEMAIARDAKVSELTGSNNNLQVQVNSLETISNRRADEVHTLNNHVVELERDLDHWKQAFDNANAGYVEVTTKLDKIPLPIRAHFTGESLEPPKPEPVNVPITENRPEAPEMKPVLPEDHPAEVTEYKPWPHG